MGKLFLLLINVTCLTFSNGYLLSSNTMMAAEYINFVNSNKMFKQNVAT